MKCQKCQSDSRADAEFCGDCGTRFEAVCPDCGRSNPPGKKFCDKCGQSLAEAAPAPPADLSFEEKLDKIQRYLPGGLTEKILAQRGKIEGERKQVTVMFCDAEGFSLLSERLGAEKVYSIMDEVFETLIHKVHEFGGTVNKMTGDGVMALFGAPIALEDAPQRAIRSGLAIQREIARLSDSKKEETGDRPIRMRVGIHTGPVVVGSLGNDLRVEFTAVGDTVNLASRMEGLAEPGTVYVTGETFKATEGLFRFEALGEKQIKGREASVHAYRVIAPSTRRTRFDVSAERGLTLFLGRERELDLLLDGLERAKSGRGQAFSIMGEAGVGKSRLLYEFRKALGSQDVTLLEGRCLSYGANVAYHPFIDLLKSAFAIGESDDDEAIRRKFEADLKELGVEEGSTLPYLLELLSVEGSGIDAMSMSPEARRDRIMEALKRVVLASSQIRPLVMAVEDLHWVDRSSEDALKHILDGISGARVMLIFTHRPEYVHTWGGKSYHSQVTLNRLSNRESLAMAAHLLGTEEIGTDLEELILEKTEGIPFFIEEFVKSLKDLNIIEWQDSGYYLAKDVSDLAIPSTIHDVIMARVDSLPEAAKNVLQTGSVIEREFSYELIKRVTGIPEKELLSHLSVLRDSELLYERGIFPEASYVFKHTLTREVVYDSILDIRKRSLHVDIGDAIEDINRADLDNYYEVLAQHYMAGENWEKGAEYYRLAERRAEKAASLSVAIVYAERRVACLERLAPTEEVQRKVVDARTALGLYCIQLNRHIEANTAVEPVAALALEHGYARRLAQIRIVMANYAIEAEGDLHKAIDYLEDALRVAQGLNDPLSLQMANTWLGIAFSMNCEFERAGNHWDQALQINIAANVLWGMSTIQGQMSVWLYCNSGRIAQAYHLSEEALRMADESGDVYSKAHAYTCHGVSCLHMGFLEQAELNLQKGIGFSDAIDLFTILLMGLFYLGETYSEMGQHDQSKGSFQKNLALLDKGSSFPYVKRSSAIALALAKVKNGETDIDLEFLHRCRAENRVKYAVGSNSRHVSAVLLHMHDQHVVEAQECIKEAIEADTRNGMRWHLAKDHAVYADLFKRKGDIPKAREQLAKAIDIFKECGADGWVTMTEEELKALA